MEDKRENIEIEEPTAPESNEYNASFDPDPDPVSGMSEDELQDSILEDSGMNAFQKFCAKVDDKKWLLYQHILGVLLACGTCVALFWKGSAETENAFSWSLIVAIVIAIWVPNIVEKQALRKISKARTTMAIAMAIIIVIYFVVIGLQSGFNFRA